MADIQSGKPLRRFIAGTRCPECSKEDTTVLFRNEQGDDIRECVSCGFVQTMGEQLQADAARAAELATRVSPLGDKALLDEGEQALKIVGFMDPNS